MTAELCAHCRLPVASHAVRRADGLLFCRDFCARQHPREDGAVVAMKAARERIVEHARRKAGARTP
jgi:hypothetical protein